MSNLNSYLESKLDKPKVMLFGDQKVPPFVLKAVAHTFYDTMHVGYVQNTEEEIVKKYKITTFPTLMMIRRRNEKPILFKGELKFNNVFDFLNPYSEKFVFGDVKSKQKEEEAKLLKPWLNEEIPEFMKVSANDVCYNTGKLCVIYLDTKEPDTKTKDLLKKFKDKYAGDNKFAYMWMNAKEEPAFFKIFQVEMSELPKLAFLNVGTLKRVMIHSGALNEADLQKTYDSIYNADARFTRISAKNLPDLTVRNTDKKTDL